MADQESENTHFTNENVQATYSTSRDMFCTEVVIHHDNVLSEAEQEAMKVRNLDITRRMCQNPTKFKKKSAILDYSSYAKGSDEEMLLLVELYKDIIELCDESSDLLMLLPGLITNKEAATQMLGEFNDAFQGLELDCSTEVKKLVEKKVVKVLKKMAEESQSTSKESSLMLIMNKVSACFAPIFAPEEFLEDDSREDTKSDDWVLVFLESLFGILKDMGRALSGFSKKSSDSLLDEFHVASVQFYYLRQSFASED